MDTNSDVPTLSVRRMERNFLLSPMSIQLLMTGSSCLTFSSIGTGATFSPPAVIKSSAIQRNIDQYHNTVSLFTTNILLIYTSVI